MTTLAIAAACAFIVLIGYCSCVVAGDADKRAGDGE